MRYLTKEQMLLIHSIVIDTTSGMHGVRDIHAILSLEHAPRQEVFGKELYPTVFLKAAMYIREILTGHPFLDGNKRSGMAAAAVFLERNGYEIIIKEGGVEKFALRIVHDRLDVHAIAKWLKDNSRKIKID